MASNPDRWSQRRYNRRFRKIVRNYDKGSAQPNDSLIENSNNLTDLEKKLYTSAHSDSDNEKLFNAARKFANNEELSKDEAKAVKDRLDLEKPAPAAGEQLYDQLNKGYTGKKGEKKTFISKLYHTKSNSKLAKRVAIAGVATGGSVIGGAMVFMALLPFKIEHIVQNLESHYGAPVQNAVGHEEENIESHYFQKYVLPGLTKPGCTSTATDKNCVHITGCAATNPVCRVYQVNHQVNLEKQLADKYGIEFGNSHGRIYMRAPGLPDTKGLPGGSVDITDFEEGKTGKTSIFDLPSVKRTQARQAMRDAFKDSTKWPSILIRFKYGKFIEEKYGIKRCVIACKIQDNFADAIANKKQAAVLFTVAHVIEPRSAALATAISCLMSPTCQPDTKVGDGEPPADGSDPLNGEVQTVASSDVQQAVDEASQKIGAKTLDSLAGEVDKLNKAGSFQGYVVEKAVEAMGLSAFTKGAMTKAIPIVGWFNTAAEMTGNVKGWGPKIKAFATALKKTEAVSEFAMEQTTASEIMAGETNATELGSMTNMLDNGGSDITKSNEYQRIIEGNTSLEAEVPDQYSLNNSTSLQRAVEDVSNSIPGPVATLANLWNESLGRALGGVSGLACDIPLVSTACSAFGSLIGDAFKPIFTWLTTELFRSIVDPVASGTLQFFPMALGADVAYNGFAQTLGAPIATAATVAEVQNEQLAQQKAEFDSMPIFARIFDTSSSYSLISRLAMDMPTNMLTATDDGLTSVFNNPLARLGGVFSSLFTSSNVFAAGQAQSDDFSVPQRVYSPDDPTFSNDPAPQWDNLNCGDTGPDGPTTKWNNSAVPDDNGELQPQGEDPCQLIQAASQSACGYMNPSCLPPGSQNNGDSGATASGTGIPSGTAQQLAQQILSKVSSGNITFQTTQEQQDFNQIVQTGHQTDCGNPAISPTLLGVILAASQKYNLVLGVFDDGHICGGPHSKGDAVDINGITPLDGSYPSTGRTIDWSASEQPLLKQFDGYIATLLSANGGGGLGQEYCFKNVSPPTIPSNVSFFDDTCDHQHVDVMQR